jgi:hypothetical protein
MTERVYEKRLDGYPKALELTEPLRRRHLLGVRGDVGAYLDGVRIELQRWHSGSAAFIMSKESLDALYELRDCLEGIRPERADRFSESEVEELFSAKNQFRRSLSNDIRLLFDEDGSAPGIES